MIPPASITWIEDAILQWFHEIIRFCRESHGALNFHDALIALACQHLAVRFLVSFDPDFDPISWLTRIHDTAQVATLAHNQTTGESA